MVVVVSLLILPNPKTGAALLSAYIKASTRQTKAFHKMEKQKKKKSFVIGTHTRLTKMVSQIGSNQTQPKAWNK